MVSLDRLMSIMTKLRAPDGCPWDREQTHETLKPYVIEEAYEVVDAINSQNPAKLVDELGDLLLQVVFHAQVGAETGTFTMDDVIEAICTKLIRRHPHVFSDTQVDNVADVLRNWEMIKQQERQTDKEKKPSLLGGIPQGLPALLEAEKMQRKAAKIGFDWSDRSDVVTKLSEELTELNQAMDREAHTEIEEELGDVLFSLVNLARFVDVNPEIALKQCSQKFKERFSIMEQLAESENLELSSMNLTELDALWDQAKAHLRSKPQS